MKKIYKFYYSNLREVILILILSSNIENNNSNSTNNKQRRQKISWFNPSFNKGVTANVAKVFLKLPDKQIPKTNKMNKTFNRNSVKANYSCGENICQMTKSQNKNVLKPSLKNNQESLCNCNKNKKNIQRKGNSKPKGALQQHLTFLKRFIQTYRRMSGRNVFTIL